MNESQFNDAIDETLIRIEDALEGQAEDADYESNGGVLTLSFVNGSVIILNRQVATFQLWVAAKSGGFHLDSLEGRWMVKASGESLAVLLNRLVLDQGGEAIDFSAVDES